MKNSKTIYVDICYIKKKKKETIHVDIVIYSYPMSKN
jgi:hypothetical protein